MHSMSCFDLKVDNFFSSSFASALSRPFPMNLLSFELLLFVGFLGVVEFLEYRIED